MDPALEHSPFWMLIPVTLVALAAVEGGWLRARGRHYDWREFGASLGDAALRALVRMLPLSAAAAGIAFVHAHRLTDIAMTPAAWVLLFVLLEFAYYWMHRTSHAVRWFWATHAVHHSSSELSLASALRLGVTSSISGTAVFFAPLVYAGFPPTAVFGMLAANLVYQYWLHAAWLPRLGPLELVLNTPAHHRVHHACNVRYLDANFGGVVIVFDRIFGTCVEEVADEPCRYGLARPVRSFNPLWIAVHEWVALARDLRAARGLRQKLATAFGPPR